MPQPHLDILTVSDLRLPGGTSASIAEEVRAQARGGLSSGLLHVDSPLVQKQLPFNPRLRACVEDGVATVVVGDQPVACDLLVLRHPTVIGALDPTSAPPVDAGRVVMVANQAPGTPDGRATHYDPREVDRRIRVWLGDDVEVVWAPIGPLVRDNLALIAPELVLAERDWTNIIDVDAWHVDRSAGVVGTPVLGRHSRNSPDKWPTDPAVIAAAYPERDDLAVRVLGGDGSALAVLGGKRPHNWSSYAFGTVDPVDFLADVDFFVYYHHPDWVEAFGRTVLEALSSGAVAILPDHFRPLFGDACLYREPHEVEATVRGLAADRDAYVEQSERGRAFVAEHFGHQAHVDRVCARLGRDAPSLTPHPTPDRDRVLFVSTNGSGVGHLMRLMSMARRSEATQPLFLTLSQALGVVHDLDYYVEYVASRPYSGAASQPWHQLLQDRLIDMIDAHGVKAIVFDGTWPYQGLLDLPEQRPDVRLVWSRRAMWRPGITNPALADAPTFDLILEPGEFAGDDDHGVTRELRPQALELAPLTFLDREEQLSRADAREQIGLDPDRPAALVQLGAGNINDTDTLLEAVVARLGREADLQICVTRSAIADRVSHMPGDIRTLSVYPLARYLGAFDFAVAASGYNTFHELVATPVPTLFIPNLETSTDDQGARAWFAHRVGVGTATEDVSPAGLDRALAPLLDPEVRRRMVERAEARLTGNGAPKAMAAIEELVAGGRPGPDPAKVSVPDVAGPVPGSASTAKPAPAAPPKPSAPAATTDASSAAADSGAAAAPTPAADASPTAAVTTEPEGPVSLQQRVKRVRKRATKAKLRAARWARKPEVRAVTGAPFRKLPVETQRRIRRRLRRWERNAGGPRRMRNAADAPLPVPPGTVLPEEERGRLTPVLVVLPETLADDEVVAIVDAVAGLQLAHRTFAPLFVTGSTAAGAFRRHGYLFEYLPAASTWEHLAPAEDREGYVRARLGDVVARYRLDRVVTLEGLDDVRNRLVPLLRR